MRRFLLVVLVVRVALSHRCDFVALLLSFVPKKPSSGSLVPPPNDL
jgi:hypothetical protein